MQFDSQFKNFEWEMGNRKKEYIEFEKKKKKKKQARERERE